MIQLGRIINKNAKSKTIIKINSDNAQLEQEQKQRERAAHLIEEHLVEVIACCEPLLLPSAINIVLAIAQSAPKALAAMCPNLETLSYRNFRAYMATFD